MWYIRTRFLKTYLLQVNLQQQSWESREIWHQLLANPSLNAGRLAERANELERDPRNFAIPPPRFARKFSTRNPPSQVEGAHPQNCMVELPRNQVSELHFDKFPDLRALKCWKTNFKTGTVLWIKDVETTKSVDDLVTSRSMRGYNFPNFEMLDAKIASALEQDHLESVLQEESQPGRTKRSNTRQISSRKTDCSHDLRKFPS